METEEVKNRHRKYNNDEQKALGLSGASTVGNAGDCGKMRRAVPLEK